MFGINQLLSIGTEGPEFYADLLCKIPRPANRRLLPDGQSCPDIPGIQNLDAVLSRRLQVLLDSVADISLCRRGNVSATMASLKIDKGTPETQLYIVFNHEGDDSASHCDQHLQDIFTMLSQVPYIPPAEGGSPKVIAKRMQDKFLEICKVIHDYSYEIFYYRVTKRSEDLSTIRGYIEQDQEKFTDQQRSTLLTFLEQVDKIITITTTTTDQFPISFIKGLVGIHSFWKHHDLLPRDPPANKKLTLLDYADAWLAEKHRVGFQLQRWALKIMSFVIAASRLFMVTQSPRLHQIIHGKFSIQVLSSASAIPYCCHLSPETIQGALDAAAADTRRRLDDWDKKCKWFINEVLGESNEPIDADHLRPTVHAELAMIIAMAKGEIKDVLPYVGVSKLSCTMCSHYIDAFNEVWRQKIVVKGSHGKAHPGWFWPSLSESDEELRRAFLGRVRRQLLSDFEAYAERRLSDSSVGSDVPQLEDVPTAAEINEWLAESL